MFCSSVNCLGTRSCQKATTIFSEKTFFLRSLAAPPFSCHFKNGARFFYRRGIFLKCISRIPRLKPFFAQNWLDKPEAGLSERKL
jgi:hypothetical protein